MRELRLGAVLGALAVVIAGGVTSAAAASGPTRYSLAGGCYTATGADGRAVAQQVRMQATSLGRYLLYTPDQRFVAAQPDGSVAPASAPSDAADWRVSDEPHHRFALTPLSNASQAIHGVRFEPAAGCATYPEAELDATGTPTKGAEPYGRVGGLVEGHMHWMTYEYLGGRFHCGRPWHPYGIPYALPDCSSIEGPQGLAAPFQNFLNFGNPAQPHDTTGWPTLASWSHSNLTYEGTYWRWIQRAYLGGLRLMVMSVNENRVLCLLQANRQTNCDEMDTVRRGFQDLHDLQDYVDAQAGGPGKGFFQIVTNPYDARRVINQGRMAVVLEIEVSEPFGCTGWDQPTCDQAQVDRGLDEMHRLGVRSMLLLNKFDNPLVGVRFDSGPVGLLINGGNRVSAGSFWDARTCTGPLHDNTIFTPEPQSSAALSTLLQTAGVPGGTAPAYPPPPHCNTRGLTPLGQHLIERMMDLHMIVNPDHMSQAGVSATLDLLEQRHYSGVISPHGWMDPGNWPRLWKLGGMAFPGHSDATDYVKQWQEYRPRSTPYFFGWGYGADLGGLSEQPAGDAGGIAYPFKGLDPNMTFQRQRTGSRTFDYNAEGVAHYGLYADWFADLRRLGGDALARDLWNGAEAYLEMWERADGVPAPGCSAPTATVTSEGLGAIRLGDRWTALLHAAGQPQERGRAWSWCAAGDGNDGAADVAELTPGGTVELAGSTAHGRRAGEAVVGDAATGPGLHVHPTSGGRAFVVAVAGGRVRAVAVASRALAADRQALTEAMTRLLRARASQTQPTFEPNPAQTGAAAQPTGQPLAGTSNAQLNAALTALCSLQSTLPPGA